MSETFNAAGSVEKMRNLANTDIHDNELGGQLLDSFAALNPKQLTAVGAELELNNSSFSGAPQDLSHARKLRSKKFYERVWL